MSFETENNEDIGIIIELRDENLKQKSKEQKKSSSKT